MPRLFPVLLFVVIFSTTAGLCAETPPEQAEAIKSLSGMASNIQKNRDGTVRFVRFSKSVVTDEHVARIEAFKQLDYLAVVTPSVTDAGLTSLDQLTNLDTLYLSDSGITDASLTKIKDLSKLERLYLDRTEITDAGLANLSGLTTLQTLSLQGTPVTDNGLAHLSSLENLEALDLSGTKVSDAGILQIAKLPKLKTLSLDATALTGSELGQLAALEQLEQLSLRGTSLTPSAIESLADFKKLKQLLLTETSLTRSDVAGLPEQIHVTLKPAPEQKLSAFEKFRAGKPLDAPEPLPTGEVAEVSNGEEIARPISVRLSTSKETPDFQRHVIPLLGRLGCNGRTCHGSFQGQGGFSLSMFGYDFHKDLKQLTGGEEPRVNLDSPDESLIIYKPTHGDEHGGGDRYEAGSWQHQLLKRWISGGAKGIEDKPGRIVRFDVTPAEMTFTKPGETAQLRCVAVWDDGTSEDVTPLTRFQSNDDVIAEVTRDGLITCKSPGDTYIVSFYDNGIFSTQVLLPVSDKTGDKFPAVETPTPIDRFVTAKLSKLGIVPSELCTDEEFLRRVTLDTIGTLPTPAEVRSFLNDSSPDKRQRKIDELLESPAYADWWSIKLADLTGSNSQYLGSTDMNTPASIQWNQWLRRRVQDNVGWDEIAAGIILARSRRPGQTYEEYAAEQSRFLERSEPEDYTDPENPMHYYWFRSNTQTPTDRALSFGYVFMGVRLQCAQCHKHPFDQWSKQDFEQFTQFFTRIKAGVAPDAKAAQTQLKTKLGVPVKLDTAALRRQMYLRVSAEGLPIPWNEIWIEPAGKEPQIAKLLGDQNIDLNEYDDPLEPLMAWLLREENPYFAPAFVNRVWEHYFGVGIVDPPDDFNMANPPSNKALLEWLSDEFIKHEYDLKWLHRTIANSRTYQLSWRQNATNRADVKNFSHSLVRRLPAEVTIDAILQSTANDNRLKTWSANTKDRKITQHPRSLQARGVDYSLLVFGKPLRSTNCDCERQQSPTLLQSLYVRNDLEINEWLQRKDGWLIETAGALKQPLTSETTEAVLFQPKEESEAASEETIDQLIEEAYLRTLSRVPTEKELTRSRTHLTSSENTIEGLRDLLWVLINTQEFLTNH